MQIIDLGRLSTRGKWCTLGGSIIMILASLAFWIMLVVGSRIGMLSIDGRADALTVIIVALIIGLGLILVGTLYFGRHDDHVLTRPRGRA